MGGLFGAISALVLSYGVGITMTFADWVDWSPSGLPLLLALTAIWSIALAAFCVWHWRHVYAVLPQVPFLLYCLRAVGRELLCASEGLAYCIS
jgi:hypothetical protein